MRSSRLRSIAFVAAAVSVGACAAILGIEDRLPLLPDGGAVESGTDTGIDSGDGGAVEDAPFEVSVIPDAECVPATCTAAGGACVSGACQIPCNANCNATTINCPANTDCQILCEAGACLGTQCAGGHSCTVECPTDSCVNARCTSERCTFHCGNTACANVSCNAAVSCRFECEGTEACDKATGITGTAGSTCDILCTGAKACGGGGGGDPPNATLRCNAPDSGIVCIDVQESCKDAVLSCGGEKCTLDCQGLSSCEDGYCCEAGTCVKLGRVLDSGIKNRCP